MHWFEKFGGALPGPDAVIEYSKYLIDQLTAWCREDVANFDLDDFTRSAPATHCYDSMIVIEKRPMTPPYHRRTGILKPGLRARALAASVRARERQDGSAARLHDCPLHPFQHLVDLVARHVE